MSQILTDPAGDELPPPPPKPVPAATLPGLGDGAPASLPDVPGYDVLGEVGRGGMAVVYRARDRRLQRLVALKMILAGAQSAPEELARFRAEAETVARLRHPGIVQIFDVGEWNGQPYFALEYLDGGSLADHLGTPLPPDTAAGVAETLARAVQHAHDQGVIHRDLKPANVLIADRDFCLANWPQRSEIRNLKIVDFGLAKRLDAAASATQAGSILGTPQYMAPEQAGGKVQEVGPLADVYALGTLLYEMLTGRPPFVGATAMETVLHVLHDDPAPPRLLNSRVPRDLETICLKCLRKEPGNRYGSAGALADDLRRFLERRPIVARPVGTLERGWRWARRNPAVALLTGAVAASLLLGFMAATYFAVQSGQRAAKNLEMKHTAERHLYLVRMNMAARAWEEGQVVRVLDLLRLTSPEATDGVDLRGFEWYYLWRLCHEHDVRVTAAHDGPIGQVAWSPRGSVVATAGHDGRVRLWDPASGAMRAELRGHDRPVLSLAFAPDGGTLASGDENGNVTIWDVPSGQAVRSISCRHGGISCLKYSHDGVWLLAGSGSAVWRWRTADWSGARVDGIEVRTVYAVAWSRDAEQIVAAGGNGHLVIRDAHANKPVPVFIADSYVTALAVSADGQRVAAGALDGHIKIWDVAQRKTIQDFRVPAGDAAALAFAAGDRVLIHGGAGGAVTLRDLQTGTVRRIAHVGPIQTFAVAPDEKSLAIAGPSGQLKWARLDLRADPPPDHPDKVYAVAVSPDGRTAASASRDGSIYLWDVATGTRSGELTRQPGTIWCLAFDPRGERLATGGLDGCVRLWNVRTREQVDSWPAHPDSIWSLTFGPDGKLATAGYLDRSICLWDPATHARLGRWECASRAWCVAVSPDGRFIAGGGGAGDLTVWDIATGAVHIAGTEGAGWVWAAAFSPDGGTIAASVEDAGQVRDGIPLWDMSARTRKPGLRGHPVLVRTLGFFPDGQTLYSGSDDGSIKLWDLVSREERATLIGSGGSIRSIAVTPDGRTLVSGNTDGRVRFWRAATPAEVEAAHDDFLRRSSAERQ